MKARSLRGELTFASLLTTFIALLLSAGSLLIYELNTYRTALVADLRTQADLIARSTAPALVFNDAKAARENLALLELKPTITAAAIYAKNGDLFAGYSAAGERSAPPLHAGSAAEGVRIDGDLLEVTHGIEEDGEVVGTLSLKARNDISRRAANYAAILAAVSAVSLAVGFLVFRRLQHKVTTPLLRMTEVAHEVMARRDWTLRAPEASTVDIAVLVDAFNGMLAEVGARTGELETSNEKLALEMVERRNIETELKVLDQRKDEFLATLAHELRNPLAAAMASVELLRSPRANEASRTRSTGILDRQLRLMVRLIDDLLDVSRVTTGKLSLRLEAIDLCEVLRSSVELADSMVRQKHQSLTLSAPAAACRVNGDSARLAQVFSNLLSNASRYTPMDGSIAVELSTQANVVEVAFRDTGFGVEPSMQERIFDLFEQGDKSLERGSAGLGIGLTLARQLARLHGGDITVRSQGLGHGSCFLVRLPVAAPPPADVSETLAAASPRTEHLRILVADDNVDFATSFAEILEALGHRVEVVHDGIAALGAVGESLPDVAMLDIGMPGLNGYEVARRLREDPRTAMVRLMAITGWGQAADKEAASRAGFEYHFVKPVSVDSLEAALLHPRQAG